MGQPAMQSTGQKSHATRCKLKNKANWEEWLETEKKQLDEMDKCNIYGEPIIPPKNATILRLIWTYVVKHDGCKKAHNWCNGSMLKRKGNDYANTYSACASQVGMHLFIAIAAIKNYLVIGADATNAYAQSFHPAVQLLCVLAINSMIGVRTRMEKSHIED
eukprot:6781787-Ditylum_brightwellii.AAC.2